MKDDTPAIFISRESARIVSHRVEKSPVVARAWSLVYRRRGEMLGYVIKVQPYAVADWTYTMSNDQWEELCTN